MVNIGEIITLENLNPNAKFKIKTFVPLAIVAFLLFESKFSFFTNEWFSQPILNKISILNILIYFLIVIGYWSFKRI